MKAKKIMLIAGEVSGDLHGSHLVEAIQEIDPEIEFFGIGGEGLEKRGMKLLRHAHSLSVVGISEAFRILRTAFKALQELKEAMERERPDLVILIDYPEFNLLLARQAKNSTSGLLESPVRKEFPFSTISAPRYGPGDPGGSNRLRGG